MDYAIRLLDGVKFDGRTLRVSREKSVVSGGGFGSARWAGSENSGWGGRQSKNTAIVSNEEKVVENVTRVISKEITDSSDPISSAIGCTAAMSLLSSVDAFGLDETTKNEPEQNATNDGEIMTNQDFHSRCQRPLSELLHEYGEQDLDWKKHNPTIASEQVDSEDEMTNGDFASRCQLPLSDLLNEYGEQDVDWKKQQSTSHTSNKHETNKSNNNNNNNGMLAPQEKAFLHLQLLSFGYKYGAPTHSKRGFSYAHPLPPYDCRDLERAPAHVAKFHGLSFLVKKALLNPSSENETREDAGQRSPMRRKADEIADDVIKILVEAIDEGGHGPISPLTMTISIGSEYGRHRAVVLVEHLAVVVRARLRRNDGRGFDGGGDAEPTRNGIVRQLVSVETRHRDIDARHKDEEAFGEDLKREVRAAEKAKRRQDREDGYW